mgnify:CR=1 FL=1
MTLQEDLRAAVDVMRRGGIILYPTDTVWGIGCDATNEKAVAKVNAFREEVNKLIRAFRNWGKENGITFVDEPGVDDEM